MSNHTTVACALCKHRGHILIKHIAQDHKLSATQYMERFPDAPLYSKYGQEALAARWPTAQIVQRETERVAISSVFPGCKSQDEVTRYKTPAPTTPETDEDYVFPEEALQLYLLGRDLKKRNRTYIKGYAGTGKTQLVTQASARLNDDLIRVNGDSFIMRSEWVGEWKVRGGEMVFQYGVLPTAMRRGATLLLDEYDCLDPRSALVLRPVLEENPRLVIMENGGEVVTSHPDFRVVATANTWGAGDTTGLFGSTNVMSVADRQRFSLYVKLDYLEPEVEQKMLQKAFTSLEDFEAEAFVKVANEIRTKHKEGKLDESFSPRQLLNWVEKYIILGDVQQAARVCFLNSLPPQTEVTVAELIQHVFNPTTNP